MNLNTATARMILAEIQAAWNAAASTWNPDAFAALYTEDALFFGGRPDHCVGGAAIHAYFASYQDVLESATLDLVDQHFLWLADDCFLAQGFGDFAFVLEGGKRTSRARMRTTLVIAQHASVWKIRQHHFSVPPESPPI
ncbi:SgcJ/EcaC family oxidoreductase [Burkholderia sp. Ax-1719]|uniref:YybH family protein n=1 Tax=Burkholderia sp. Ax-1719 TaxID=2608334 RepID=UPI00141FA2D8|nr:SgcJ/EcaC family oxidoreductase [Burkholderia sp. Ax-1719]NIE67190.1 nuclear transport factor 2 family protein [Burkholderia sp. Ax-1719]